jgi:CubicO group peptidase (beta-lactamase class C family)
MKFFLIARRLPRWVCAPFASLAFVAITAHSRGADAAARMEEIVQKHVAAEQFTGAVLVAKRGAAVFDRAYGLANREWDIANTPATHFRIGSITKQFTAVALLLLEERGRLKLTDPVSAHLPDAPAAWSKITLHHLLTHTSGIPNFTHDPEFFLWKSLPTTAQHTVGRFRDLPLDFPPGDRHTYSNSNYLVLGLIVETLTGRRFGDFLRENVLDPLGLKESGFDSNERILPRRASGYVRENDRFINASYSHMSVPHAAGAMYSTTHDLWRWAEAVFGDKLLTPASRTKLLTPVENGYALGVRVTVYQGRKIIEHGGNLAGFSSFLRYYPELGVSVVALSNMSTRAIDDLGNQLAAAALDGDDNAKPARTPITVPAATLATYCGVYEVRPGTQVTFRLVDGNFTAQPTGQQPMPVFAESETRFFFKTVGTEVEFVRDESGRVTHLMMMRDGRARKAPRIAD